MFVAKFRKWASEPYQSDIMIDEKIVSIVILALVPEEKLTEYTVDDSIMSFARSNERSPYHIYVLKFLS